MDKQNAEADGVRDRHARFGELPARIRPDAAVETVATGSPQGRPAPAGSEAERQALLGGG